MYKVKKTLIKMLFLVLLLGIPLHAHASVFVVHLYFDAARKTLVFDKQAADPVTLDDTIGIDPVTFTDTKTTGSYELKLYEANDTEVINTEFNKKDGAFTFQIPYFSTVNKMRIVEKSSGKEILQADLSKYMTCDGNNICEYEKGENKNTCLEDCGSGHITYDSETQNLLKQNNGVLKDPQTGEVLLQDKSFASSSLPSANNQTPTTNQSPGSQPSASQQSTATSSIANTAKSNLTFIMISAILIILFVGFLVYKKYTNK